MKQYIKFNKGYWTIYKYMADVGLWLTDTGKSPRDAWNRMNNQSRNRMYSWVDPRRASSGVKLEG